MRDGHDTKFFRQMRAISIFTMLAFLLAGLAIVGNAREAKARRRDNAQTWHAVICKFEQSYIVNPVITRDQTVAAIRQFDGLLRDQVHTDTCHLVIPRR